MVVLWYVWLFPSGGDRGFKSRLASLCASSCVNIKRGFFFSGKENLKFITSLFHIAGLVWDVQKAHTNLKMHEFCSVITIWCQKDLPLLQVTNCSSDGSSEVQNEIPLHKDWLFRDARGVLRLLLKWVGTDFRHHCKTLLALPDAFF